MLAFASALAVTLGVSGGLGVAPAEAAKARARIVYTAIAVESGDTELCVGDALEITVSISRHTTINGRQYRDWISGGYVYGGISNDDVGHFEPRDQGRPVGGPPLQHATFVFRAVASGKTDIVFTIGDTGEERRVPGNYPRRDDTVSVEVVDCYDAYTSGLGTTFTQKDMGDLMEPFTLAGRIASGTVEGITQSMTFTPDPQDSTTGVYVFIDTAWATADPRAQCTAYITGEYDVVLYGNPAKPVEGDLLMTGTGVQVCGGISTEIDYSSQAGFRIGFRPRPAP
jgi:hypothetical protein